MKFTTKSWKRASALFLWASVFAGVAGPCPGQSRLSLEQAVQKALESRESLKAEADRISVADGMKTQAGLFANPTFQFENQNLRPDETYARDVDTYAYLTQPLDILGKRGRRIDVASRDVGLAQASYAVGRRELIERVKQAYWKARGAQEAREVLNDTLKNFQGIVDYHTAQLSVGAISEQDLLRIRLESERLQINASMGAIDAMQTRVQLQREMGQGEFPDVILTEPLDSNQSPPPPLNVSEVLDQRVEIRAARAALDEAQAKEKLEAAAARPDISLILGYKRTQLVESSNGENTALAGLQVSLPVADRNQGNRDAARSEVRRQQHLLAEAEVEVRANFSEALAEFDLRRREVLEALQPLRQHSGTISEIAQQAYRQGGTDLLRLLDAERARLEGELTWVQGMVQYQQSVVALESAEGLNQ